MSKKHIKIIDFSLIWKFINNELTGEEEQFLKEWVEEDAAHREYFNEAKIYYEKGSSFDSQPYNRHAGWQAINQRMNRKTSSGRGFFKIGVAVAIILIFSTIAAYWGELDSINNNQALAEAINPGTSQATLITGQGKKIFISKGQNVEIRSDQAIMVSDGEGVEYLAEGDQVQNLIYNTLITPRGGEFFVKLSDGTKVWLNAASKLIYPERFAGNERQVELEGEGYFEVAHDATRPFYVTSGDHQVVVLGTSFNISAYPDNENIVTTLVEGKVSVRDEPDGMRVDLMPNEQSIMNRYKNQLSKDTVDPYQFVAWKEKTFYFENRTLKEIVKSLSRWYDVEVFFENTDIENLRFTGGFKRYNNFSVITDKIEKTNEVKFEFKDNMVIIK